jgi:hypothetical protein
VSAVIVGFAISAGAVFGGIYKVPSPTKLVVWYAAGWLLLGVIVTALVRGRDPAATVLSDLRTEGGGV